MNDAGAIERYGKRIQRLGSGSITEHRWYPCTLRGVRWLQVVADGRMVQKASAPDGISSFTPPARRTGARARAHD